MQKWEVIGEIWNNMELTLKDYLIIVVCFAVVVGSYYGAYYWGKKATYKALVPQLITMTEETYREAYEDGKKQGQIDCMILTTKGLNNE